MTQAICSLKIDARTFNTTHRAHRNILVPQLPSRKVHDILLRDLTYQSLHLFWVHPTTCSDNLPPNVFCYRRCTIKGK